MNKKTIQITASLVSLTYHSISCFSSEAKNHPRSLISGTWNSKYDSPNAKQSIKTISCMKDFRLIIYGFGGFGFSGSLLVGFGFVDFGLPIFYWILNW